MQRARSGLMVGSRVKAESRLLPCRAGRAWHCSVRQGARAGRTGRALAGGQQVVQGEGHHSSNWVGMAHAQHSNGCVTFDSRHRRVTARRVGGTGSAAEACPAREEQAPLHPATAAAPRLPVAAAAAGRRSGEHGWPLVGRRQLPPCLTPVCRGEGPGGARWREQLGLGPRGHRMVDHDRWQHPAQCIVPTSL